MDSILVPLLSGNQQLKTALSRVPSTIVRFGQSLDIGSTDNDVTVLGIRLLIEYRRYKSSVFFLSEEVFHV